MPRISFQTIIEADTLLLYLFLFIIIETVLYLLKVQQDMHKIYKEKQLSNLPSVW